MFLFHWITHIAVAILSVVGWKKTHYKGFLWLFWLTFLGVLILIWEYLAVDVLYYQSNYVLINSQVDVLYQVGTLIILVIIFFRGLQKIK
jgi:hypothetical protein